MRPPSFRLAALALLVLVTGCTVADGPDPPLTMVSGGTGSLVKVCGWYDNEVGYSARCVDLLRRMAG